MRQRYLSFSLSALALLVVLAGCGSSTDVAVNLSAENEGDPLPTAQTRMLTAEVVGTEDDRVTWEVEDGELETDGTEAAYTAPTTAGTYTITVTSVTDAEASASIDVNVEAGVELWSHQFGTAENDYGYAVATDASGNVYVAGSTGGDLFATSAGFDDAFIVKFDSGGERIWTKQIGGPGRNSIRGLAIDGDGNVYATGSAQELFPTAQGDADAFIVAYDATGAELWSAQFGSPAREAGNGVAVDGAGNVYITGYTQGDLFETGQGANDAFIAKYDSTGTQLWGEQRGSTAMDSGAGVVTDESGVYAVGSTDGDLFGTSSGFGDVFVIKFDLEGSELWSEQYGTDGVDDAFAAAPAAGGGVHFAGVTTGSFFTDNEGGDDAYVATVGADGGLEWGRHLSATVPEEALGLATDQEGNIVLAGHTYGAPYADNAGGQDLFVTKLDSGGDEVWGKQFGTAFDEEALAVAIDSSGNVVTAGTSQGELFGPTEGDTEVVISKHTP